MLRKIEVSTVNIRKISERERWQIYSQFVNQTGFYMLSPSVQDYVRHALLDALGL